MYLPGPAYVTTSRTTQQPVHLFRHDLAWMVNMAKLRRDKRSEVWLHFKKDNDDKAKCNAWGELTKNLRQHSVDVKDCTAFNVLWSPSPSVSSSASASSTSLAPPVELGRVSSNTPFSLAFKGKLTNITCMIYVSRFPINKTYNNKLVVQLLLISTVLLDGIYKR